MVSFLSIFSSIAYISFLTRGNIKGHVLSSASRPSSIKSSLNRFFNLLFSSVLSVSFLVSNFGFSRYFAALLLDVLGPSDFLAVGVVYIPSDHTPTD